MAIPTQVFGQTVHAGDTHQQTLHRDRPDEDCSVCCKSFCQELSKECCKSLEECINWVGSAIHAVINCPCTTYQYFSRACCYLRENRVEENVQARVDALGSANFSQNQEKIKEGDTRV